MLLDLIVPKISFLEYKIFLNKFLSLLIIFLQKEKLIKWKNNHHQIDGVTTNGILLMHIDSEQFPINSKPPKWKEVSVGGSVFDLGEGRLKLNYQTIVNIQK
jgi:pellino protein